MLVHKPVVNPLARSGLLEIQRSGVRITEGIVLWVQDAAERIKPNRGRPDAELVDWPRQCGGVLLRPLSFAAAEWLGKLPDRMQDDPRVVGFACAHSNRQDVLEGITGTLSAALAVTKWAARLPCSVDALAATVAELVDRDDPLVEIGTPSKRLPVQYGAMIHGLVHAYPGTTPDYWLWQVGWEYACSMANAANASNDDPHRIQAHEVRATAQFRAVIEHIKREAKAEQDAYDADRAAAEVTNG